VPDRIPTFKPPWVNRKPRQRVHRDQREAGYGRKAWKLARAQRLVMDDYQCQHCGAVVHGREAHVDHVVSKADGGSDLMDNLRTLCRPCHARRTVTHEQGGSIRGGKWSSHPSWMPRACIPVTLVCGPPASGKSRYVDMHKGEADLVIDLDVIASGLAGTGLHSWGMEWLGPAVRERNEILAGLHKPEAKRHARAWLIAMEPEAKWRQWWVDTLGCSQVVVIETPAHVCDARLMTDPDRAGRALVASQWWKQYTPRHGDIRC
jgi:hypothetical protein